MEKSVYRREQTKGKRLQRCKSGYPIKKNHWILTKIKWTIKDVQECEIPDAESLANSIKFTDAPIIVSPNQCKILQQLEKS